MKQLTKIRTTGPVSVERVDTIQEESKYTILIVGQTGVGKSSFIETFSTDKSLGISKNQLESVTQTVVGYKLVNVERDLQRTTYVPMYIIDTPGFSDPKISEMKVIKMILKFTQDNNIGLYNRILFLDRITDTRMSGSKGRNLDLFKALTGEKSAKRITIVTTMWDQVWREDQREKAQERFDQLQSGFWEEFVKQGAKLVKFENKQESTLELLDAWVSGYRGEKFGFEAMEANNQDIHSTPLGIAAYENLVERIVGLKLRLQSIEGDLADKSTRENADLLEFFQKSKIEAQSQLRMFQQELLEFNLSPCALSENDDKSGSPNETSLTNQEANRSNTSPQPSNEATLSVGLADPPRSTTGIESETIFLSSPRQQMSMIPPDGEPSAFGNDQLLGSDAGTTAGVKSQTSSRTFRTTPRGGRIMRFFNWVKQHFRDRRRSTNKP
ncbi:hypothetical protein BJ165DRAFT_1517609 [Panaeolus papilionaceus]|nr:hypothetical protein BJ165DRAFT_1517609 [Panaeolus papilionaceus]